MHWLLHDQPTINLRDGQWEKKKRQAEEEVTRQAQEKEHPLLCSIEHLLIPIPRFLSEELMWTVGTPNGRR